MPHLPTLLLRIERKQSVWNLSCGAPEGRVLRNRCLTLFSRALLTFALVGGGLSLPTTATAETDPLALLPPAEARQVLQWGADLVRDWIPATYQGERGWGRHKKVQVGLSVRTKGGRFKTHRRWKQVEHGRWVRYQVELDDPTDPERLRIRVQNAEVRDDRRLHFDAQIDTRVDLQLTVQRWNLGTRLISITVDAVADLSLRVRGDVGFEFDLTRIPPDILVDPHIESTDLELVALRVDRISKIGGDLAESIGDLAERVIADDYLPRQQQRITDKLNRQIDRRRDRWRIGASDWLTRSLTTTR